MSGRVLFVFSLSFAAAMVVFAAENPDKMNLHSRWDVKSTSRDPVIFDHAMHQNNNACTDCHDTQEGGSKLRPETEIRGMTAKNPAHTLCWDCHTRKRLPGMQNCIKCHKE